MMESDDTSDLGAVTLRLARLSDVDILNYWDEKPHVVAAGGEDDWFDWASEIPRPVDWRELLIAELAGRPIGVIQIIDPAEEETHYWGDVGGNFRAIDIWIGEESDLGRGYGARMMHLALERCFADQSVRAVLIDPLESNRDARRFYEREGFKVVGPQRFGDDDCIVYRFDRRDFRTASL